MTRQPSSLSKPLVLGVGLLCFALSFALSSLWPIWGERGRLTMQVAELTEKRSKQVQVEPETETQQQQMSAPKAPEAGSAEKPPPGGRLQKLQQLTANLGLNADSVAYRKENDAEQGAARYHVTIPLKAPYLTLRKFVESVLTEVEGSRLERLSFQRIRASEQMVDAEIAFVLDGEGAALK